LRPQYATCAGCGTATYVRADMVGDLCPACWLERDLAVDVNEAFAAAERRKNELETSRRERQERADRVARETSAAAAKALMVAPDATDEVIQARPDGSLTQRAPATEKTRKKPALTVS